MNRPSVSLIALGGTISSVTKHGRSAPRQSADEMIAATPELGDVADLTVMVDKTVGGHALTLNDLHSTADAVRTAAAHGTNGIVIAQGTDTLEETAYALALMVDVEVPVVLTGAMRMMDDPGADGPANLLSAIRVAIHPDAAGLGPVVVLHDEIHPAWSVTKVHPTLLAGFASPTRGPVGIVSHGEVELNCATTRADFVGFPPHLDRKVEIVWGAVGSGPEMVEAATSRVDGLVVAGLGGGGLSPAVVPALRAAIDQDLPVVLATRCAAGSVLRGRYVGAGTDRELLGLGLVPAGEISAVKARLRLLVALCLDLDATAAFPVR